MSETTARPFSKTTLHDLERFGCREIRALRDVGVCRWIMARETASGRLLEIEGYDKSLTNSRLLLDYKNRCVAAQRDPTGFTRLPERIEESGRGMYFIRTYMPGEPLYQLLLRPGRLNSAAVARLTASLCTTLQEAAARHDGDFRELLPVLFVTEGEGVLLDAPGVGPWITFSEAAPLLAAYCDKELSPSRSARQFAMRLFARLTIGDLQVTAETVAAAAAAGHLTRAERYITERIVSRPGDLFWPDTKLAGYSRFKIGWVGRVGVVVLAIAILYGARQLYNRNVESEWVGESSVGLPAVSDAADIDSAPVPGRGVAGPVAVRENPSAAISAEALHVERLTRTGLFAAAQERLTGFLRPPDLEKADRQLLEEHNSLLEAAMLREFELRMIEIDELETRLVFEAAIAVTEQIISHYPKGHYHRSARERADTVRDVRAQYLETMLGRRHEEQKRARAERDVLRVIWKARPIEVRPLLRAAREKVTSETGRELLYCLETFHENELKIVPAIMGIYNSLPEEHAEIMQRFKERLPARIAGELQLVTSKGPRVVLGDRPEMIPWAHFTSDELYRAFFTLCAGRVTEAIHQRLYIFCVARKLGVHASTHLGHLESPERRAEVERIGNYHKLSAAFFDGR
jgi:hypothetical protein